MQMSAMMYKTGCSIYLLVEFPLVEAGIGGAGHLHAQNLLAIPTFILLSWPVLDENVVISFLLSVAFDQCLSGG